MRGQMIFWDFGQGRDYRSGREVIDDRHSYGGIGIVETHKGAFDQHVIRGFVATGAGDNLTLSITDYSRDVSSELFGDDVGELVKQNAFPRPSALVGLSGGGLVFRRTRMPAEYGKEVLFAVLVGSFEPGQIKPQQRYALDGAIGRWPSCDSFFLRDSQPGFVTLSDPVASPAYEKGGIHLEQLLKLPLWGWGDEPVAFRSTMDLKLIDDVTALDRLYARVDHGETLVGDDKLRFDKLCRGRAGGVIQRKDEQYLEFRRRYIAEAGHIPYDSVETQSEAAARGKIAERIIREMMNPPARAA